MICCTGKIYLGYMKKTNPQILVPVASGMVLLITVMILSPNLLMLVIATPTMDKSIMWSEQNEQVTIKYSILVVKTLLCMTTGADLGLQLVLNIEEYQYVDFLDQIDSGFKVWVQILLAYCYLFRWQVHLHAQYEIPSVSSSGFGVSPGTHALASVTYTKVLTHLCQCMSNYVM